MPNINLILFFYTKDFSNYLYNDYYSIYAIVEK